MRGLELHHESLTEPLVPPGNARRPRALVYLLLGFAALCVLMASDAHWALSVPCGLLAALVCSFGALDFSGCFDDAPEAGLRRTTLRQLAPSFGKLLGAGLASVLALRLAVAGTLPHPRLSATLLVTSTLLASLIAVARLLKDLRGSDDPLRSRFGLLLMLLGVLLYVPLAGGYSLLDPWETHYGEVSREMLARDDWISFWWSQEGWFWSKPALDFWLQGLSFALLGVNFRPDQMLGTAAHGASPAPEWAARLPIVLLSLVAVYTLYRFVAAAAGRRVGFLAGVVLLCAPYWALLAHQSMTDMPYVAPLTAAIALFGLALLADANEHVTSIELVVGKRTLRVSAFHALLGLVLLTSLPQLAHLVSRNVTLQLAAPPYGFRWHWDELFSGSGLGNCGLPGNEPCRETGPANPLFQPALGAAIFGAALAYLVELQRGERRKKRLLYVAAWYFTALAALGKGAPGFVLPIAIAGAVLVARRDWSELLHAEPASLLLVLAAVCLPWYVQAYMRHGEPFTDRLLFHDMYKRAFVHVHDTNTGDDVSLRYYIWQLGYGLFPWTGLIPIGLGILLGRGNAGDSAKRDLALVVGLWLTIAFALFTLSLTKFHHYALPCAPPLAVAVALVLDRALGQPSSAGRSREKSRDLELGVLAILAAALTLLVARDLSTSMPGDVPASARLLHLVTYNYKRVWPSELDFERPLWLFGLAAALPVLAWLAPQLRRVTATFVVGVGVVFCAFTLWIYLPALAPHYGQRELVLAYYAARHGPEEPLVAYQMNWKGENFYTGNRLPAFVSTGAKFKKWLKAQRKAGKQVLYFLSEHGRIGTLKSELGPSYRVETLTNRRLNNKFALVRVRPADQSSDGDGN
ncbi:MAG TPA: glycosyltransferase family 39 protein [Polyangiaceae bacterium]|nr:glycosyltransferase family 39 protein [Polyangiaceae bacterium]